MRSLQSLILALLAMAAKADIPDFQYLYPCDSGVIDCNDFPMHHGGRLIFPTHQLYPIDGLPNPQMIYAYPVVDSDHGGSFGVAASNDHGQAIGDLHSVPIDVPNSNEGGLIDGGNLYCLCIQDFRAIDINNNGVWLGEAPGFGPIIGSGVSSTSF